MIKSKIEEIMSNATNELWDLYVLERKTEALRDATLILEKNIEKLYS
jgi:hypothetical protein